MAYTDNETFGLSEVGAEELWITYTRPGMIPYEEAQTFLKSHKNYSKDASVTLKTIGEFFNDADIEFQWVMSLITAWNLCKPGTDEILLPPSQQPDNWNKIPGLYLTYIVKTIKNDPTGSDFLVKGLREENNGSGSSMITLKP